MQDGGQLLHLGQKRRLLARPAWVRMLAAALGLVPLWLAVAWAVSAP